MNTSKSLLDILGIAMKNGVDITFGWDDNAGCGTLAVRKGNWRTKCIVDLSIIRRHESYLYDILTGMIEDVTRACKCDAEIWQGDDKYEKSNNS